MLFSVQWSVSTRKGALVLFLTAFAVALVTDPKPAQSSCWAVDLGDSTGLVCDDEDYVGPDFDPIPGDDSSPVLVNFDNSPGSSHYRKKKIDSDLHPENDFDIFSPDLLGQFTSGNIWDQDDSETAATTGVALDPNFVLDVPVASPKQVPTTQGAPVDGEHLFCPQTFACFLPDTAPWPIDDDPVRMANGELVVHEVDLVFDGPFPYVHTRSYGSRRNYERHLGFGWDISYDERLVPDDTPACDGALRYTTGALSSLRFERVAATATQIAYRSPGGVTWSLLGDIDAGTTTWRMIQPDGVVRYFDSNGLLRRVEDAAGNGLTVAWDETAGDDKWRLSMVTDSVGREIVYHYNADGFLAEVVEPVSGDRATYVQDARGFLVEATNSHHHTDYYEYSYDASLEDVDDGEPVPEGYLTAACETACAPSDTSCQAGGACDVAEEWVDECLESCETCPDRCNAECSGACAEECDAGCGPDCVAGCDSMAAGGEFADACDTIWSDGFKDYCDGCNAACAGQCADQCSAFIACIASDTGLCEGHVWDTIRTLFYSLDFVLQGLLDSGICVGSAIVCGITTLFGGDCDADCDYDNVQDVVTTWCRNDCTSCCRNGTDCAPGSCNEGRSCEDDCKAEFDGVPISGDTCEGGGVGCEDQLLAQCKNGCRSDCTSDCRAACQGPCAESCVAACDVGDCGDYCDGLDLPGICLTECVEGCVVAQHDVQGGPRYGRLRDLNGNLTAAYNGHRTLYLVNTYGDDPADPSFDSVTTQWFGDSALQFDYRDLAAEARGELAPPGPKEAASLADSASDFEPVEICPRAECEPDVLEPAEAEPSEGETGGKGKEAGLKVDPPAELELPDPPACGDELPGNPVRGASGDGPKPARATIVRSAHGDDIVFYFDEYGRTIRSHNHATGAIVSTNYDDRGRRIAVEQPMGGRECVRYDANGNVVESVQMPAPTSEGAAVPVRSKFSYTGYPVRIETVWDPRDPASALEHYTWDSSGNLATRTGPDGLTTVYTAGELGIIERVEAPDGSVTDYRVDPSVGLVDRVVFQPAGAAPRVFETSYDSAGRPVLRTLPGGGQIEWIWVGGQLQSMRRTAGGAELTTDYTYDDDARLMAEVTADAERSYTYNRTGGLETITTRALDGSAPDAVTCFDTAPGNRILEVVLPGGERTRYSYDGAGNVTLVEQGGWWPSERAWDDACAVKLGAAHAVAGREYDLDGQVTKIIDATFAETTLTRDGLGRAARVRDPGGTESRIGYDLLGRPQWTGTYGPDGYSVPYRRPALGDPGLAAGSIVERDAAGRVVQLVELDFKPDGAWVGDGYAVTRYAYDLVARTMTTTNDLGHSTVATFDGLGRPTEVVLPTLDAIDIDYDLVAGTETRSWPAPTADGQLSTTLTRTAWGAPLRLETMETGTTRTLREWTYDDQFRLVAETDASGLQTTFDYDALGRATRTARTYPDGTMEILDSVLDANGLLLARVSKTESETSTTTYARDELQRPLQISWPDGSSDELTYLAGSELIATRLDARGVTSHYSYDPNGQLARARTSNGGLAGFGGDRTREFEYDRLGHLTLARDFGDSELGVGDDVVTALTWSSLGQKLTESNNLLSCTVIHNYDNIGQPVSSEMCPHRVAREYDPVGRVTAVAIGGASAATFQYDGLGGATSRSYANGVATTFTYDTLGRLALTEDWDELGAPLTALRLERPLDGIPRLVGLRQGTKPERASVYDVDTAGRLIGEDHGLGKASAGFKLAADASWEDARAKVGALVGKGKGWRFYELDGRHNWLQRTAADSSLDLDAVLGSFDDYVELNGAPVGYDGVGSITGVGGSEAYQWDAFGDLRVAEKDGIRRELVYDALGRLVTEYDPASGNETIYGYDGIRRVFDYDDATGELVATVPGQGLNEHIARVRPDGERMFYHQDHQSSVYALSDESGAVVERYHYSGYGEIRVTDGAGMPLPGSAVDNSFGFQGHPFDAGTGLVHMRARFYSPQLGRFLSRDPIGFAGGSNVYAFVSSGPTARTDYLGLSADPPGPEAPTSGSGVDGPDIHVQDYSGLLYDQAPYEWKIKVTNKWEWGKGFEGPKVVIERKLFDGLPLADGVSLFKTKVVLSRKSVALDVKNVEASVWRRKGGAWGVTYDHNLRVRGGAKAEVGPGTAKVGVKLISLKGCSTVCASFLCLSGCAEGGLQSEWGVSAKDDKLGIKIGPLGVEGGIRLSTPYLDMYVEDARRSWYEGLADVVNPRNWLPRDR